MACEIRGTASPERQPKRRIGRIRTFSSLRNRDYRFLWLGNTFNSGANWLQQLTVGWLVWDLSHSPFLVGTVGGLRAFPFLVIGPFAGVMADRLDRRKVVMLSQTVLAVAAFLFALLVASGRVQVWHAFAYIIISGTAHAILQPTRSALVANTVPREDLPNAFALQSMSVTSSRFVWPAIGGILVGAFGFKFNFFVESALYLVLALLIIPVRTPYREQSRHRHASGLADMKEGITYVWQDKLILCWRRPPGSVPLAVPLCGGRSRYRLCRDHLPHQQQHPGSDSGPRRSARPGPEHLPPGPWAHPPGQLLHRPLRRVHHPH
jgi:MFS family permease